MLPIFSSSSSFARARILGSFLVVLFPVFSCAPASVASAPPRPPPPRALEFALARLDVPEPEAPVLPAAPEAAPPDLLAIPEPPPAPIPAPLWPSSPDQSEKLPSGIWNPMPGGVIGGYRADTGLDIMGIKKPVYAIGAGKIDYAEYGHTLWTRPQDTAYCIRIELDEPIPYKGRKVTHIYYAHLSEILAEQPEGATPRMRVEAGQRLGTSGVANGSWHLHLGFLLDGEVDQRYWGTFLLEDAIREVMGGYRNKTKLPEG